MHKIASALILLSVFSCLNSCATGKHQAYKMSEPIQPIIDKARNDAQADGKQERITGFCLGVGCFYFGVGFALVQGANVPAHRLAALEGKSAEYISIYIEEYVKETKRERATSAVLGCLAALALVGVYFLTGASNWGSW